METTIKSFGLIGIEPYLVTVESDISRGLPSFDVVGLPDTSVKEAKDRIRAAARNSQIEFPVGKIVVNLAPADTKKIGSIYDLPMLISILKGQMNFSRSTDNVAFIGEISLNGELRAIRGILPMALGADGLEITTLIIPYENAAEGGVAEKVDVLVAKNITEVIEYLLGRCDLERASTVPKEEYVIPNMLDISDVKGQFEAKRAIEIAASGSHNILMIGSPGSGKSMLAQRIPSILPIMNYGEQVSTTKLYSISGNLPNKTGLLTARPFRAPHHNISSVGLTGGGLPIRPGEISLAHNGVLFLDEMLEFPTKVMEMLRQPLEADKISISRATGRVEFPCRFMLVGAMNPCPCGYYGHPSRRCSCKSSAIARYMSKISGPLLDRMDIHVEVSPLDYESLTAKSSGENSHKIRLRVEKARNIQTERFKGTDIVSNSNIPRSIIEKICVLTPSAQSMLKLAFEKMGLSARGYDRILKVSRTIADLDESDNIDIKHISEAIQYRSLDRKYWFNQQ